MPVRCHLTFVTNVTFVKRHSRSWEGFICCTPVLPIDSCQMQKELLLVQ